MDECLAGRSRVNRQSDTWESLFVFTVAFCSTERKRNIEFLLFSFETIYHEMPVHVYVSQGQSHS